MAFFFLKRESGQAMALPAIPDELLAEIFIRLPTPNDVIRASRVCASFHRVVADRSFLRRFRKLHARPLLGFLAQRRSHCLYFHPTFVPYPSKSAANAIATKLSFSFLPARHWALCDTRDGWVLLNCVHGHGPDGSFFVETVVCDPLRRRYLRLPPIPDDLVALMKDATLKKERGVYETFLLPPGVDDEEEYTSFRVIYKAICKTKLVTFVFSSSTGQWRAGPTLHWSDLFPDVMLSRVRTRLFSNRQYANRCFYWLIGCREKLLVLDTRMMEFSSVDAPPRTRGFGLGDIAIVEEGEDASAMFVRASATSYLKYTAKRISDGSYSQWNMVKRMSLDSIYFFVCSMGRYVLLYKRGTIRAHDPACFSLDINTFQLERVCASMPGISNTHMYSNFPPSLLSTPTVSIDMPKQPKTDLEKEPCEHGRNGKRKIIGSDDETQSQPGSPDSDDTDNIDDVTQIAPAKQDDEDQYEKIQFTCEQNFTYARQDQDHGSRSSRPPRSAPSKYRRMSDLPYKGTNK